MLTLMPPYLSLSVSPYTCICIYLHVYTSICVGQHRVLYLLAAAAGGGAGGPFDRPRAGHAE